ncbi:hypothetical protein Tsubulata_019276, partial [Turnera subulata]
VKISPCDVLEGWSGLWRGVRSGLVRDSVYGGIFFRSWQLFHTPIMLRWKYISMEMKRRMLKWRRPGKLFERSLLLRGMGLRMAPSGLASSIIVGSYYLTVDYLLAR